MDAISMRGLRKTYKGTAVVDGLDLELSPGRTLALLGPNGAGKTTTVEILTGHRRRDAGTVSVLGIDPANADARWRAQIGVVPQHSGAFGLLTPREAIGHLATLYSTPMSVDEVLARLDLVSIADQRISSMSGGQMRRVDVACGIVGRPEILFLDEPTTGLDPAARRSMWRLIEDLGELGTAVLLTSHYMEEVEALADDVVVMVGGRAVSRGTPASLGGRAAGMVEVSFADAARTVEIPSRLPGANGSIERRGDRIVVTTSHPTDAVMRLGQWSRQVLGTTELPDLQIHNSSLEDVYLRLLEPRLDDTREEVSA